MFLHFLFIAIRPTCIPTKTEAHMYKWLNSLLEKKNYQMKESASWIDFETLCTMKPKKFVKLRKPVAKPVLIKNNREKLDEEVLKYIQRNHAASDLVLNHKQIKKRLSLSLILSTEENVSVTFTERVSQQKLNAINPKHYYAVSDLALNEKIIDKRLSLPVILTRTENEAPLYSCTCINDLSTCESTTSFKNTGKNSNSCINLPISIKEKMVKCTKECLDDKGCDIFQEDVINDLNFLHRKSQTTANQKGAALQSLVPVFVDNKEKEPLNFESIGNKELKGDNEKKIKVGRLRKTLKNVRNMFRKYF